MQGAVQSLEDEAVREGMKPNCLKATLMPEIHCIKCPPLPHPFIQTRPAYNATPDADYKSLWKMRQYARV